MFQTYPKREPVRRSRRRRGEAMADDSKKYENSSFLFLNTYFRIPSSAAPPTNWEFECTIRIFVFTISILSAPPALPLKTHHFSSFPSIYISFQIYSIYSLSVYLFPYLISAECMCAKVFVWVSRRWGRGYRNTYMSWIERMKGILYDRNE